MSQVRETISTKFLYKFFRNDWSKDQGYFIIVDSGMFFIYVYFRIIDEYVIIMMVENPGYLYYILQLV